MHYMSIFTVRPENRHAVAERFKQTGGAPTPDDIKRLGRWFAVGGGRGFAVWETDDPVAITKWCRQWSDLMEFEIVPVVDDDQFAQSLSG